ncbi:MAG: ABC transporter permease [Gemmatimonadaceae bacterium]
MPNFALQERLAELASDVRYRWRALVRRDAMERELDEELRFHVEREAEKLEAMGVPRPEARRRAHVAFGGIERTKEESRAIRGVALLERLSGDVRLAARSLAARPAFTGVVVLTLALGIGANAAMFGVVDRLLFRAPPYLRDASHVHRVATAERWRGEEERSTYLSYARYLDFAHGTRRFDVVAATNYRSVAVGTGEDARELPIGAVSASFWSLFDAPPALGRYFAAREDTLPAGTPVAVLGYGYWQSRFGGKRDVLGQSIMVGPATYTIIGVAPRGFTGTSDERPPALYVPITHMAAIGGSFLPADRPFATTYSWTWLQLMARRRASVTMAEADADLTAAFARSYAQQRVEQPDATPIERARPRAFAAPLQKERGPDATPLAMVARWVSGVALVVLLIAAANVANLLLARAMQRRREVALRLALGVTRGRLLSQLLTESLLLALVGGASGIALAQWGGAGLRLAFLGEGATGGVGDTRTLVFAGAIALCTGLLTGLAPALHAGREDLSSVLKAGMREGTYRRSRLRGALLVVQGALSVVLLVGAGLFVRSFDRVQSFRLGYDIEPVLYVSPNLRGVKLSDAERAALARRLRDEAATIPGVERASRAVTVPFWNTWSLGLYVAGVDSVHRLGQFTLQSADPQYFETVGTRVLRGRGLQPSDVAGAGRVMLVSQSMAAALWPREEALGKCVKVEADSLPCTIVVGVTENIRQNSLSREKEYQYYLPIEQFHPENADLFIRASGDASALAETVRRRLQPLMPGAGYVTVTPMQDIVGPQQKSWRVGAMMFSIFGLLSLVLAAVGLYGVIAYDVSQRSHELGVRIALGARAADVVRLVTRQGVRFAGAGMAIGGAISLIAGRWVAPLLFDQSPRDPVVYAAVTGTLLLVALAATVVPAWRATRVDPNRSLRVE